MSLTPTESKQFIGTALQALSGQAKTADLGARFVTDPCLREHIQQAEAAFPCYELVAEDLIAERDLVAMRGVFRGVHRGTFAGIPATGRTVSAPLQIIYLVHGGSGGRVVEHWLQFDGAAVVNQLQGSPAHA
jgi:predicted ester cyclase